MNRSKQSLEGLVSFEVINRGSKSEHTAPVLYVAAKDGDPQKKVNLSHPDDPPFNYPTLIPYTGKYVKVKGNYYWSKFIIDSIEEIDKH